MPYHVILKDSDLDDAAVLSEHPKAVEEDSFRFDEGVPLATWFPAAAIYPMDAEFPDRRALYDLQLNTLGLIVASKALRVVLESGARMNLEFLPITIVNHRGKVASKDYCIVNVTRPVDCVDRARSTVKMSAIDPTRAMTISKLVLDEAKVPANVDLFRLSLRPGTFIVREELKARIEGAKLAGMSFVPIDRYNSAIHR